MQLMTACVTGAGSDGIHSSPDCAHAAPDVRLYPHDGWMGPEPAYWQKFLFRLTTTNEDGSISVLKTIPCESGTSSEVCVLEVCCTLCTTYTRVFLVPLHCFVSCFPERFPEGPCQAITVSSRLRALSPWKGPWPRREANTSIIAACVCVRSAPDAPPSVAGAI